MMECEIQGPSLMMVRVVRYDRASLYLLQYEIKSI